MIKNLKLGHLKISQGTEKKLVEDVLNNIKIKKKTGCIPLNVTKYCMAMNDIKLADSIKGCNLVIADGLPIAWLAKRLGLLGVNRITGVDFSESLICRASNENLKLLGGKFCNFYQILRNI